MHDDSDRVTDDFAARARDLTPASARDAACVLYVPVSRDSGTTGRCASLLSDAEVTRAGRFVTEEGTAFFMQRRAFRRYCAAFALGWSRPLSRLAFEETGKGRPFLRDFPDLCFSFSSCPRGFVGAWSSTRAIGVDVEDRTRSLEAAELARRYFAEAEAKAVEAADGPARLRAFFQLWTLKEAALKSIGEGLPAGLDAFEFALRPAPHLVRVPRGHGRPERFRAYVIEEAGGCAALVLREGGSGLPMS